MMENFLKDILEIMEFLNMKEEEFHQICDKFNPSSLGKKSNSWKLRHNVNLDEKMIRKKDVRSHDDFYLKDKKYQNNPKYTTKVIYRMLKKKF